MSKGRVGSGNPTTKETDDRTENCSNQLSTTLYKKSAVRRRPPYIHGCSDHDIIRDVQCAILDVVFSKGGSCDLDTILAEIRIRPDEKWFIRQALSGLCHNGGAHKPKLLAFVKYSRRCYMLNPKLPITNTSRPPQNVLISILGSGVPP